MQDKVGGPFIPENRYFDVDFERPNSKLKTEEKYYLVSLGRSEFHKFSPQILTAEMQEKIIVITEMMHRVVEDLSRTKIPFEVLVEKVIEEHGVELEYFYEKPLQTNKVFLNVLQEEYESAVILHETGGKIDSEVKLLRQEYTFFKRISEPKSPEDKSAENDELGKPEP